MQTPNNIAIIGAGPSGLMAAEILATAGHRVTVYDRMPTPARKLLIAGRGGLNLTHSEPLEPFLKRYGAAADWLASSIHNFPPEALRAWCEGLGQETFVGSSGRVFPKTMKAVALLRAWLQRLEGLGVTYAPRHIWHGWEGDRLRFTDDKQQALWLRPHATLIALGGASWPRLGSDGAWVKGVVASGIEVAPLRPSNCGFLVPWSSYFSSRFAGEPLKPVALSHQGQSRQGEAMITAQGIEGGAVYALSASLREAIETHGSTTVQIDLRPNMTVEALAEKLPARGNKSFSSFLRSAKFPPVAVSLLHELTPNVQLSQAGPYELAGYLKALPLTLTGTTGIARAISSAGGILRHEVNDNFMLNVRPGTFIAGEMLDWEAPTGGYLLQACFSTAVTAAQGILRYCDSQTSPL